MMTMSNQIVRQKQNPNRLRILSNSGGKFKEIKNRISKTFTEDKIQKNDDSIEQKNSSFLKDQYQRIRQLYQRQRSICWQKYKQVEGLTNQLKVLNIQIQSIHTQNAKIKQQLKLSHSKIKELQNEKIQWMQEFYKLNNSITFNQAKFEALQKNQQNVKKQNQVLKKKINQEKQHNINIYKNIQNLECNLISKNKQIGILKDDNKKKQIQIIKLKQQKAFNQKQSLRRIKTQQQFHQQKCLQIKSLIQPLQLHNKDLQHKVTNLLQQLKQIQQQLQIHKNAQQFNRRSSQSNLLKGLSQTNSFRIKLIIKQSHIQKLNNTIKNLQQRVQYLQIQNTVLENKKYAKPIFSPRSYNKFSNMQNEIKRLTQLDKKNRQLSLNLQGKQEQLEKQIIEKQKALDKIQYSTISERKISADLRKKQLQLQNNKVEMTSKIKQLTRQVEKLKKSGATFKKQIQQKDKIILKYIGK